MGLLALLLWPARGLFAYTACALALYLLVVSVSLNKLAMDRRNAFLPFGGQKTAEYLWRYLQDHSADLRTGDGDRVE